MPPPLKPPGCCPGDTWSISIYFWTHGGMQQAQPCSKAESSSPLHLCPAGSLAELTETSEVTQASKCLYFGVALTCLYHFFICFCKEDGGLKIAEALRKATSAEVGAGAIPWRLLEGPGEWCHWKDVAVPSQHHLWWWSWVLRGMENWQRNNFVFLRKMLFKEGVAENFMFC